MKIYQVDAFTDRVFGGNPAAVCPLEEWLPEEKMQQIAEENNLSETAFFVKEDDLVHIRWFTPEMEIDLCGHATLASAHVIFNHMNYKEDVIRFRYGEGNLSVKNNRKMLSMDFPAVRSEKAEITDQIVLSLGKKPLEAFVARDLMVVFENEKEILGLEPDFVKMVNIDQLGVIATAPGDSVDFVSRFFAPRAGISEDPVTGSAHCMLIPFWADRLGKNKLEAMQLSRRKGKLSCELKGKRVGISGYAVTYLIGEINI
jgi:PhzF family phenazine biosynthesis protein